MFNILQDFGGIKCKLEPVIFYWEKGKLKGFMYAHVDAFCYGG